MLGTGIEDHTGNKPDINHDGTAFAHPVVKFFEGYPLS